MFVTAHILAAARGLAFANSPYASIQGFPQGIAVAACPTLPRAYSTQGTSVRVLPITPPPSPSTLPAACIPDSASVCCHLSNRL